MPKLNWERDYEALIADIMPKHQIPGLAVAVAHQGEMVYGQGYGFRDAAAELPVTLDTVFGVGSITKSFACVAIMQLQEDGLLTVDDPVIQHIPEFRTPDANRTNNLTIHHLMTHTSGLPPLAGLSYAMATSMEGDPALQEDLDEVGYHSPIDTFEQLLDYLANADYSLLADPGKQFSYSNDGYALLGLVVERVTGKTFEAFVTERILKAAGMVNTGFDLSQLRKRTDVTQLYSSRTVDGDVQVFPAPQWQEAPAMVAAGFLRSTARDVLRYLEIYRTGGTVHGTRILSEDSVRQMIAPHVQTEPGRYYGYGLTITTDFHGMTLIHHGGLLTGIAAHMCVAPEQGWSGIALANLADVPTDQIVLSALNGPFGLPLETRFMTFPDSAGVSVPGLVLSAEAGVPSEFEEYIGTYVAKEGQHIEIGVNADALVFGVKTELYQIKPAAMDYFAVVVGDTESPLTFLRNEQGEVYALFYGRRVVHKVAS